MRRLAFVALFLLTVGGAVYFWSGVERKVGQRRADTRSFPGRGETGKTSAAPPAPSKRGSESPTLPGRAPFAATAISAQGDFPIAAALNAPDSTIARDLAIVQELLDAWQSNFPREGNPVGENAEITAALMGDNPLRLTLIPKDHRALNDKGELCDRWGTPFRFHQLSGTRMEVRSAGPDRRFASSDDALWTPP